MESEWLKLTKRILALSRTGLFYAQDPFDQERYQEIHVISQQMLALLGQVPLTTIHNLVDKHALDYETPKVDVRGAIIKDDKILLVREKSDGLWTLPGGFADIGLTAAQNVEKEILEETCLQAKATQIYAIKHKASDAYDPDPRDFYKLFFLCSCNDEQYPSAGPKILDTGYFSLYELPQLSTGRVIRTDIELALSHSLNPTQPTFFDRPN